MGEAFASVDEIEEAFEWVRDRIGALPTEEPIGSESEILVQAAIDTFADPGGFTLGSVGPGGSPIIEENRAWRTYSTFEPTTGKRRSADRMLDLENENLDVRTETEVLEILYDGDLGVPVVADEPPPADGAPRARCVRFASLEIQCVRAGGRIYLAGGAVHTPELLMKSGIGGGGAKVDNPEVRACVRAPNGPNDYCCSFVLLSDKRNIASPLPHHKTGWTELEGQAHVESRG